VRAEKEFRIRQLANYKRFVIYADLKNAPSKENRHRAMDDIRESIEELRYYKENIFKPKSRK